ncbi:MAG: hypothetical protein WD231_00360 [Candidatus Woykebacteria bacterium]
MGEWFRQIDWLVLKRIPTFVWGFLFLLLALLIAQIPVRFFQLLALLPGVVGVLFLYQFIFHNKY